MTGQLTESDVAKIEERDWFLSAESLEKQVALTITERDALVRDWRSLTEQLTVATDLCNVTTESLKKSEAQNAALREQLAQTQQELADAKTDEEYDCNRIKELNARLAQAESEVRSVLDVLGEDVVHAHPEGGKEDIYGSLAITVIKLQKERDELRGKRR